MLQIPYPLETTEVRKRARSANNLFNVWCTYSCKMRAGERCISGEETVQTLAMLSQGQKQNQKSHHMHIL